MKFDEFWMDECCCRIACKMINEIFRDGKMTAFKGHNIIYGNSM